MRKILITSFLFIVFILGACSNNLNGDLIIESNDETQIKEEKKPEIVLKNESEKEIEEVKTSEEVSNEDKENLYKEFIMIQNINILFKQLVELKNEIKIGESLLKSNYTIETYEILEEKLVAYIVEYETNIYPYLKAGEAKGLTFKYLKEVKESMNTFVRAFNRNDMELLKTITEGHMFLAEEHYTNWRNTFKTANLTESPENFWENSIEYRRQISDDFLSLTFLLDEVNNDSNILSSLEYQKEVNAISRTLLIKIKSYREMISQMKSEENTQKFYLSFLDETESAMSKLLIATKQGDVSLLSEVQHHVDSALDFHVSSNK